MGSWVHTTILATVIAATATVALASAALVATNDAPAAKADRLPVIADAEGYVTIETRHDGVSVLKRVAIN